jgi:hypothetical protein
MPFYINFISFISFKYEINNLKLNNIYILYSKLLDSSVSCYFPFSIRKAISILCTNSYFGILVRQHFSSALSGGKCYIKGINSDLTKRLIIRSFCRDRSKIVNDSIFPLVLRNISEIRNYVINNLFAQRIVKVHFFKRV